MNFDDDLDEAVTKVFFSSSMSETFVIDVVVVVEDVKCPKKVREVANVKCPNKSVKRRCEESKMMSEMM